MKKITAYSICFKNQCEGEEFEIFRASFPTST